MLQPNTLDACEPLALKNMAACTTGLAVDDARGLCPSGWHVPTDGEFMTLEMELG